MSAWQPEAAALAAARRRELRVRRLTFGALAAVAVLAGVVVALVAEPAALGAVVGAAGLTAVLGALAWPGRPRGPRTDAARAAELARLDLAPVRAALAEQGELAAVRTVRRQVPWVSLAEAVAVVRGLPRPPG